MKIIKFIKDVYARKKLIRFRKPWLIKTYDLRREIALFWDTPAYMPENSNKEQYEQLVDVFGFTFVGSSTVTDFLAEFDETSVMGGQSRVNPTNTYESWFWKDDGSVLSLEENLFSSRYMRTRACALEFSVHTIRNRYSGVKIFDDYFLQRSKKFIFDLVDYHWRWSLGCIEQNLNLDRASLKYTPPKFTKRIELDDNPRKIQIVSTVWKDFTLKEYRAHAKKYFEDIFKHIPSKKFLVHSHLTSIGRFDEELFKDYFGNIKIICVWRDPRDQYERCRNSSVDYVPKDPIMFSKRFKKIANILTAKHENLLVIRYEEFVTEYDRISKQIIDFLGLDPNKHIRKFYYFNPEISAKKIGIHKTYHDQEAIKIIERELKEYCWNK